MADDSEKPKKPRKKRVVKPKESLKGSTGARKSPPPPRAPKDRGKAEINWKKRISEDTAEDTPEPTQAPQPPQKPVVEPANTPVTEPITPPKPISRGVFPQGWYGKSRKILILLGILVLSLLLYQAADFYLHEEADEPLSETLEVQSPEEEVVIPVPEPLPPQTDTPPYEEAMPEPEALTEAPPQPVIPEPVPPVPVPDSKPTPPPAPALPPVLPPQAVVTDTPRLAIVIDDLGLNAARLDALMDMGLDLTLSFLPYGRDAAPQVKRARKRGFEILVHVPMEPLDKKIYSGPKTLRVSMGDAQIRETLNHNLDCFDDYVGINNHMGSAFTQNAEKLAPVMDILRERGLIFLDSRTSGKSVGRKIAKNHGVTCLERDVFIDNVRHVPTILSHLDQAAQIAKRRGYAIAIGHPHGETIQALKKWNPNGVQVVFLTHLLKTK